MTLTAKALLGLKRHFIGALSMPSRTWLEPVSSLRVALASTVPLRAAPDHCLLDFGVVGSPSTEFTIVRLANRGSASITATLVETPAWAYVCWRGTDEERIEISPDEPAALEVSIEHDVPRETARFGLILIRLADAAGRESAESITVHIIARPTHPLGEYLFERFHEPREFDFGTIDPFAPSAGAYHLSIRSMTSVPLRVSFSDLPAWMTFHVDGVERRGPLPGRFFERTAPFEAAIAPVAAPETVGRHAGVVTVNTNDGRAAYRSFELHFRACVQPHAPFVRVAWSTDLQIVQGGTAKTEAMVENWGSTPAQLRDTKRNRALTLIGNEQVEAAHDGAPGLARLPVRLNAVHLPAGRHDLELRLNVADGVPPVVIVPFRVNVAPKTNGHSSRPGIEVAVAVVAALFALVAWIAYLVQAQP